MKTEAEVREALEIVDTVIRTQVAFPGSLIPNGLVGTAALASLVISSQILRWAMDHPVPSPDFVGGEPAPGNFSDMVECLRYDLAEMG